MKKSQNVETKSAFMPKIIYSMEKKHTRSVLYELIYVSFSLFDLNECTKYFRSGRVSQKLFFINKGLWIYTLLNRRTVSKITAEYRLTNSKNKIIKYYYYLEKRAQSTHYQSPTQCPTHEHINSYSLSFLMWDSRILTNH